MSAELTHDHEEYDDYVYKDNNACARTISALNVSSFVLKKPI